MAKQQESTSGEEATTSSKGREIRIVGEQGTSRVIVHLPIGRLELSSADATKFAREIAAAAGRSKAPAAVARIELTD